MTAEEFARLCEKPRPTERGFVACCPAHNDKHPSMSIADGRDGRVLVRCFSGCSIEAIVAAVGLQVKDLMPESTPLQRGTAARKKSKANLERAVLHEMYVLLQVLQGRENARQNRWTKTDPNEHLDRERTAARRLLNGLRLLYEDNNDLESHS